MEQFGSEAETPVAPHEVRELLTRLNEGLVEAVAPREARTLSGLAVETGVPIDRLKRELDSVRGRRTFQPRPWLAPAALLAVTLGIGGWLWTATLPKSEAVVRPEVSQPVAPVSDRGLVPLNTVTYGPDSGHYRVEPTFQPTTSIKSGLSVSAEVSGVLWGAGDHRAEVLRDPLTAKEEDDLTQSIEELLSHVRNRATKRGIPTGPAATMGDPETLFEGPAYLVNLYLYSYNGSMMSSVPVPPAGVDEEDFKRLSKAAAKRAVAQLRQQLGYRTGFR